MESKERLLPPRIRRIDPDLFNSLLFAPSAMILVIRGLFPIAVLAWNLSVPLPGRAGDAAERRAADRIAAPSMGDWLEWDYLTGDWGGARARLRDMGVEPYALYTADWMANLAGGFSTGIDLDGLWQVGVILHLEELVGIENALFHVSANWYHGNAFSNDLLGANSSLNFSGWEASQALRVYYIYYQQEWDDGRYRLKAGQIGLDDDFMISEYAWLFVNSSFSQFPAEAGISNSPVYPLAAPGVYFEAKPVDPWFFRLGTYAANAGEDVVTNHGFGWKIGGTSGWAFLAETGATFSIGDLPGKATIGGIYDSSEFMLLENGRLTDGDAACWVMWDQALGVDEQGNSLVGAFLQGAWSPLPDRSSFSWNANAGFVFNGLLPGRPQDMLGVGATYSVYSGEMVEADRRTGGNPASASAVFELTYLLTLAPWLQIQPSFQIQTTPYFSNETAYSLGLRTNLTF